MKKGKAGRVYRLTEKAERLLPIAKEFIKSLEETEEKDDCPICGHKAHGEAETTTTESALLESLAELEHEQWSELIDWLIRFAPIHGELTAKSFWENYSKLANTPYNKLAEDQKESDRKFARKVLAVLRGHDAEQNRKVQEKIQWVKGIPSDFVAKVSVLKWLEELLSE